MVRFVAEVTRSFWREVQRSKRANRECSRGLESTVVGSDRKRRERGKEVERKVSEKIRKRPERSIIFLFSWMKSIKMVF